MGAYGSPDLYPYDKMERRCPKCGRRVSGKYCPECGARMDGTREKKSGCLKFFIIGICAILVLVVLASIGSKSNNASVDTSQFTQMLPGSTASDGVVEFTLVSVEITDKIVSDWAEIPKTHTASENNSLIVMEMNMKNISAENVKCINHMIAEVMYDNNQYRYNGKWVIKDNTVGFLTDGEAELVPLETKTIILVFEVPQEVCDSQKTLEIVFGSQDELLVYKMR